MKKKLKFSVVMACVIAAAVSFCFFGGASVAQTLDIGSMYKPPLSNEKGTGMMDLITKEVFVRMGVKVEIILVASTHALAKANKGLYDGDIMRVGGASQNYPNLIQVPETIYDFDFVAFSKNLNIPMTGWEGLKPYRVAVPAGWVETDNYVSEENTKTLERLGSTFRLFNTLMKEETDLIIYERLMGYELVKELGLSAIHVLEPPLSSKKMYLYLHKKHKGLVPRAAEATRAMKQDGTFQKIVDKTLSEYK